MLAFLRQNSSPTAQLKYLEDVNEGIDSQKMTRIGRMCLLLHFWAISAQAGFSDIIGPCIFVQNSVLQLQSMETLIVWNTLVNSWTFYRLILVSKSPPSSHFLGLNIRTFCRKFPWIHRMKCSPHLNIAPPHHLSPLHHSSHRRLHGTGPVSVPASASWKDHMDARFLFPRSTPCS
jgi:hypothetical protein